MTTGPTSEVLRWVRDGELIFGQVLQGLQRTEALAKENERLREEVQQIRAEVDRLRTERLEAAESLKAIAEHVTRLAAAALQRLGRPAD
ncbi:MAG TPA: hypothetical protein VLK35_12235 [Methylomirabilota bacterium]|nr:hypothetical protein [Methylomirabilota bacterium]